MKVRKLLEINRDVALFSELKIIGNNQGIQYIYIEEPEKSTLMESKSYDNESIFIGEGIYLLNFEQNQYKKVATSGRCVFEKKQCICFIMPYGDKRRKEYYFVQYDRISGEKIYSDAFTLKEGITLEHFIEKDVMFNENYIVYSTKNENSWIYRILDNKLNNIFEYSIESGKHAIMLHITNECVFLKETQYESDLLISLCFKTGKIYIKPLSILANELCGILAIGNALLLYQSQLNSENVEEKINVVNKELNIDWESKRSIDGERSFLGIGENQNDILWESFEHVDSNFFRKNVYILSNWRDGEVLWRIDLEKEGYVLPATAKAFFWNEKIVLSAFKSRRGKGVLVLSYKTGEILFFKGLKGYIKDVIPWSDGVYLHCTDGEIEEKHYYYKLTE